YVFYPASIRPKIIKEKLSKACPGIDITVFGRYRDFKEMVLREPPDAILTKTPLLEQFTEYTIKYNGLRDGKTQEAYVLLSINQEIDTAEVSKATLGTVDFLGRKEMKLFVTGFFDPPPKLKRVTKLEDLLPLMTFEMAGGVLITEKDIPYFKKMTKLDLKVTAIKGASAGIVALAVKNSKTPSNLISAVKKIPEKINLLLGVQQWR
ncbi:MAG: hypothetical protein GY757_24675, partial [bacterium]|nr:hypothetical protein [bacterium]